MKPRIRIYHLALMSSCAIALAACEQAAPPVHEQSAPEPVSIESAIDTAAASTTAVADRYYASTLNQRPEVA